MTNPNPPELMTPQEVAAAFRVDAKTVTRWAKAGRIDAVFTLGGHRRYFADQVRALLAGQPLPQINTAARIQGATTAPPPRKRTRPQAVPETLPAEQEIAVLHCGDEILIEARLAPGMSYLCDRHGAQRAARFRSAS